MTGRSKLLCGAISVLIVAQLIVGIYSAVVDGTGLNEFLNRLFLPHVVSSFISTAATGDELGRVRFHSPGTVARSGCLQQCFVHFRCALTIQLPT